MAAEGQRGHCGWLRGQAEALTSMGTVAAPLLGGFSLAAMVQTITLRPSDARWPDAAMVLFLLAAVLFIGTVQALFWARRYQVTPAEIMGWWPDADDRIDQLRDEQAQHARAFGRWSTLGRFTYDFALLCLLAALTILAVPPGSHGHAPVLRWVGVAVGAAAFAAEVIWIAAASKASRRALSLLTSRRRSGITVGKRL